MPTINAIANQINMVAGLSTQIFGSDYNTARNSAIIGGTLSTLHNAVQSEFGGQPTLNNLLENYRERREAFQEELRENMGSLRNSAEQLRESTRAENTDANTNVATDANTGSTFSTILEFARGNIPPQELNFVTAAQQTEQRAERTEAENRTQTENTSAANPLNDFARTYLTEEVEDVEEINAVVNDTSVDNRLNSVRNLVRDYNTTVNYLNENRGVSSRMNALTNSFRYNNPINESLRNIGISVNATGELTIDENALSLALENDSNGVNEVLGSEGLAGRLERDIDRANAQGERLFPNIADFARNRQEDAAESLYTARTQNTAAYAWENTGRLLGAMFT